MELAIPNYRNGKNRALQPAGREGLLPVVWEATRDVYFDHRSSNLHLEVTVSHP